MSKYKAFSKQQAKYMRKRIDECIDLLNKRAYEIEGELEAMDLDEDQKSWRQDAVQEINDFASELRPILQSIEHIARTHKNVVLTTEQRAAQLREHRRIIAEIHDARRVHKKNQTNGPTDEHI